MSRRSAAGLMRTNAARAELRNLSFLRDAAEPHHLEEISSRSGCLWRGASVFALFVFYDVGYGAFDFGDARLAARAEVVGGFLAAPPAALGTMPITPPAVSTIPAPSQQKHQCDAQHEASDAVPEPSRAD